MSYLAFLGLFLPLAGFIILLATSTIITRRLAGIIGCTTVFLSFICFVSLYFAMVNAGLTEHTFKLYEWIHYDNVQADFALHIDTLSLLMTFIITGVGFLIHVYSIGY